MSRKNNKGFTLIELLVVVAIIGILAAVGVVAYNGYTTSAKKGSSKTIHAATVKFLAAESKKCALGEQTQFGTLACNKTVGEIKTHLDTAIATLFTDKNPHDTKSLAHATATGTDTKSSTAGQVLITSSGTANSLSVSTCTASGCASADVLTTIVNVVD